MRANSHKAAYCLPRDNNNKDSGGNHSHKVGNPTIHCQSRSRWNFKRRRRAILNSSRLVVWTLIVIVISMRQHNCLATQAAVDSPTNSTMESNGEQSAPPRPEVRDDDSDVISASEILTNPIQPTRRHGEFTNSSNQRATVSSVADEEGKQRDATPGAAAAAAAAAADDDGDQQQQRHETLSQQSSRLLLQLLVLGLFILVSSALIIVYSIKFCVCQRRKERRLLRRALVGDISSACTSNGAHQASAAAYQQQQQHLLLSLRQHHPQLSLQLDPQQLMLDDNHLLATTTTTTDCACLQPATADDAHSQLQVLACLAHQSHELAAPELMDPDGLHYFPNSGGLQMGAAQQPQLILALLNRLQQLLALAGQSPASSAAHTGSPQQLSQLIVAQLQAQFSSPTFMGLVGGHQHHQVACMCPHSSATAQVNNLRVLPPVPTVGAQAPSRPPAYSELFASGATAASGNDAIERQPAQVPEENEEHQEEQEQDAGPQENLYRQTFARGRSRAPRATQPPPVSQ